MTRGADRAILVVVDGCTGLRSAVKLVFGEYAVVQRCQVHKSGTFPLKAPPSEDQNALGTTYGDQRRPRDDLTRTFIRRDGVTAGFVMVNAHMASGAAQRAQRP